MLHTERQEDSWYSHCIFFSTSSISHHSLSLIFSCCCCKNRRETFSSKTYSSVRFLHVDKEKYRKISIRMFNVHSASCYSLRKIFTNEANFLISGLVLQLPFTVYQVPYATFIIPYVNLQWFTLITGAEGYSIPLHKRTHSSTSFQPYNSQRDNTLNHILRKEWWNISKMLADK